MTARRLLSGLMALALTCASPLATAQEAPSTPPLQRPAIDTPEGGLWDLADRAERDAQNSGELIRDEALNAYLRGVACRVAADACGAIRLYVMRRPFFNAMMAPNGYTEIWSGLLLRAENEAEAAFVIGHEIGHFDEQHSAAMQRVMEERMRTAMVVGIVIGVAGAAAAGNSPNSAQGIYDAARGISDIVYLGTIASVFGFSREMEEEADSLGFNRAMAAGYDPRGGAALWRSLVAETQASDHERVRRSTTRASIFATHPVTTDRIEALDALATDAPGGGDLGRERYRAAIRPHLGDWLRDDLRRRDFGQTLHLIARLGLHGEDLGVLAYFEGEAYRLRRSAGDTERAAEAYARAITFTDAPPEAFREHGSALLRAGDTPGAVAAFEAYLDRAPNAEDRLLIEDDIATLRARNEL
jgi:predicted Zn-dependent protease